MASLPRYKKPFLDSSVFIAAVNKEQDPADEGLPRCEIARYIFQAAERGDIQLYASTLVAAEVIFKKGSLALPEEVEPEIDALLDNRRHPITWVDIDYSLSSESRRLARLYKLRANDAVHLASAIRARSDVLLRWDNNFGDSGVKEIQVLEPYWYGEKELGLETGS